MADFLEQMNSVLEAINDVLWHEWVMVAILVVGVLFTIWSGFSQYRALTHGSKVTLGLYDDKHDPGAINHFQALSAALSATVGIGNIGGVALAVALGGPGAIFWMWVVGVVGMALKTTEVTLAMMYRNVDDPENPHGGAMYVADKGFARWGGIWGPVGKAIAVIFCVTLLISTVTGGNMFQAWNVAEQTKASFGVPQLWSGIVLAVLCGLVIIGGIKMIGAVAGRLVPFMCVVYVIACLVVLTINIKQIPGLFGLIFRSAFNPAEAGGAFVGGTMGTAFLWGLKRAFFSSEAGQGSSPIAHSAAKTDEPVREGLVAGLEPFIDTLCICTLTSLVILSSGAWNRAPVAKFEQPVTFAIAEQEDGETEWKVVETAPPQRDEGEWVENAQVFLIVEGDDHEETGNKLHRVRATVKPDDAGELVLEWETLTSKEMPKPETGYGLYEDYNGASLTSHAFDRVIPGLGKWMISIAVWLFALSTVISWSYYGEQGAIYMFGNWSAFPYRVAYCAFIVIATAGLIRTDRELDNLSALGTGVMLFANLPICLIFAKQTMNEYHAYIARLRAGTEDVPDHGDTSPKPTGTEEE